MNKIYINGDFITLENNHIEAILVEEGKIRKIGTEEEILKLKNDDTQIINLEGKTMMPSFIDPHSHFFAVANNLLQVSLEKCKSIKEIQEELFKYNIPVKYGITADQTNQSHFQCIIPLKQLPHLHDYVKDILSIFLFYQFLN